MSHTLWNFFPQDSNCKSPTADLIKHEINKRNYDVKDGLTFADYFFNFHLICDYADYFDSMSMQQLHTYYVIYGHGKSADGVLWEKIPDSLCYSPHAKLIDNLLYRYYSYSRARKRNNLRPLNSFAEFVFDYY